MLPIPYATPPTRGSTNIKNDSNPSRNSSSSSSSRYSGSQSHREEDSDHNDSSPHSVRPRRPIPLPPPVAPTRMPAALLGLTGVICKSQSIPAPDHRGTLHCTIYRPRMMMPTPPLPTMAATASSASAAAPAASASTKAATNKPRPSSHHSILPFLPRSPPPLVCIPGGPGMSCSYLTALVHTIPDRAIVLYDPLGCGQSVATTANSIAANRKHTAASEQNRDNNDTNLQGTETTSTPSEGSSSDPTGLLFQRKNPNNDDVDDSTLKPVGSIAAAAAAAAVTAANRSLPLYLIHAVQDLSVLIDAVIPAGTSFHLLGHSLGGIVAYEYLKQQQNMPHTYLSSNLQQRRCRSVVLASAPVSVAESNRSAAQLLASICQRRKNDNSSVVDVTSSVHDDDSDNQHTTDIPLKYSMSALENDVNNDDDGDDDENAAARLEFQQTHECRVVPMPLPLQQSLSGLHRSRLFTAQQEELQSYNAAAAVAVEIRDHPTDDPPIPEEIPTPEVVAKDQQQQQEEKQQSRISNKEQLLPHLPCMIVRGQHDFVPEETMQGWMSLFSSSSSSSSNDCQFVTVANCSHYGMVEQDDLYGSVLSSFLHMYDDDEYRWNPPLSYRNWRDAEP